MNIPKNLRYTQDHEWLRQDGETVAVGITDYAQHQLGDIVFVELPAIGTKVKQGQSFGTVESVKAVSDLFAPVSGEVMAINEALKDGPEKVNSDPYGEAWMIKLQPANTAEIDKLMTPELYEKHVASSH
jgi:glycine cleavage system H protein